MKPKDLFPLGIATGPAHCDRKTERARLKQDLLAGTHTWLWARRRMGKTSLIEQVLGELGRRRPKIPSVKLDLNVVHDAESFEERIRDAVARLCVALLPRGKRHIDSLLKTFTGFRPEVSATSMGLRLRLHAPQAIAPGIGDALVNLDAIAGRYERRAVLVLDEFQQINKLTYGNTAYSLEGAIRHAVERARNVSYVFSGSQRHLLADMFTNPDRPLFKLCQKMTLRRIAARDYREFLAEAGRVRWRKQPSDAALERILAVTHRHPYYLNALCRRLWSNSRPPGVPSINSAWQTLAAEDAPIVAYIVGNLSAAQRAMLLGIAREGRVEHPTSREFLAAIRLSSSTGSVAKDVLETDDLIRQNRAGHWVLVNPVMAHYLTTN